MVIDQDSGLTQKIIGAAFNVHNRLGAGFLEKMYENALRIELEHEGIMVRQQVPISVAYRCQPAGDLYADLVVEDRVLVELKAVQTLAKTHEVQLVNYLNGLNKEIGLLINFGPSGVEIKRKYRQPRQK